MSQELDSASVSPEPDINPSEIALVENLQRQDLTVIEEAETLQALLNPSEESNWRKGK